MGKKMQVVYVKALPAAVQKAKAPRLLANYVSLSKKKGFSLIKGEPFCYKT